MNCCSLALVLVKRISDKALKKVNKSKRLKSKTKKVAPDGAQQGESTNNAEEEGDASQSDDEDDGTALKNVQAQLVALLSFKEALCSGKVHFFLRLSIFSRSK